ncbi:Nucleotide-binding, alpha-beta plait [Corchorus capsularis]|uniref:Nucleotide-binding, alpha-beta plait n=1 Tax=Corchorus capsularis TaxID=210143 RepID=A0A1R3HF73_COCAP|nr:Nucleotide-binding, alpha-beta plait [Corchorus capsularis]
MAIARLLLPRPGASHFHNRGLRAAKEEPKKETGTWFKGILTNIKQKMLGSPKPQKTIAGETSDSKADITASEMTQNSPHDTKFPVSQSVIKSPEVGTGSPGGIEGVSSCSTTHTIEENAFEGVVVTATSEVGKSKSLASGATVEKSSLKMDPSGKISDIIAEKLKDDVKQVGEAMSNELVDCDKERKPCVGDLLGFTQRINEKPKTLSEDLSSIENMSHLHGKISASSVQRSHASTNSSKKCILSNSLGAKDLTSILQRAKNNAATGEVADKLHAALAPTEFSTGKKVEEKVEFNDLIKSIKGLPGGLSTIKAREITISSVTDQVSTEGFLKDVQNQAKLHNSDVKRIDTSLQQHQKSSEKKTPLDKKEESSIPLDSVSEQEEGSRLNYANSDHGKSGPNNHGALPTSKNKLKSSPHTYSEEGSKGNTVLIRFLPQNIGKPKIREAFSDCEPIVNVEEVSSTKGSIFKDALVHFETWEGYQRALKKDLYYRSCQAFVDATYSECMDDTISIPDLIGDPEAPVALVKNPTRTVKVEQLSEDISSQQLKEALAFCQSGISSFLLGSTSSVVYVEFETEDDKERALAKHSIHVSGKELPIIRIDAPRTTVARISNIKPDTSVQKICSSYGKVVLSKRRANGIVDVYFKLAEWPNMLNIINGLNGLEVNKSRWLAQPAPVFPPEVLCALWNRPEERRHVYSVMCNLLRQLGEPIITTEFSDLVTKYHGKGF